jgi:hypothetical protein
MIFFAGLLTIKNWKGTTASFKGVLLPMLDTFLVLMVAWLGFESFTAQQSPRLRFEELGKDILLFQLVVLAIFACQWWLRRLCKKEQHEPV